MSDLQARTEIHEAWTNVVLANAHLARGEYDRAKGAMRDAEHHYHSAESALTLQRDATLEKLTELRVNLDHVRDEIEAKSGTLVRHAVG